jgi:TPR repeat protein
MPLYFTHNTNSALISNTRKNIWIIIIITSIDEQKAFELYQKAVNLGNILAVTQYVI